MKLLKTINDLKQKNAKDMRIREACRVVLFDDNNLVPILYVSKDKYHKIPGGEIEKGENKLQALEREANEEAGCKIKVLGEIGKIIEFRTRYNMKQISYCYLGKVIARGKTSFTKK